MLVNTRHVQAVAERKTDLQDAQWLCQLLEAGLLRASFVPPKPIRTLRNLTRYRKDAGIKLATVATDIVGKSGRDMISALVSGTIDPVALADLARGLLRNRIPALREALEGRLRRAQCASGSC